MPFDNVVEPLMESVRRNPEKTAVVFEGDEFTYRELNESVNRFAHVLVDGFGIKAGDRVAYLLPNCPELIEIYYAIQKIGAVAVPLNFKLIPREIGYLANASAAAALLFDSRFADKVSEARGLLGDCVRLGCIGSCVDGAVCMGDACASASIAEPALFRDSYALSRIQYTGGSTGLPKGAARTHHADLVEIDAILDSNSMAEDEDNVVLVQCPLEHHGGHSWFSCAFAAGATLVVCAAFDAESILHSIERHRVTYMILLPPTTYLRLLRCPTIGCYDLSSMRLVQSAAGATSPDIVAALYEAFPNAVVNYGWGQSESGAGTSIRLTKNLVQQESPLLGSIGRPMKHVSMKIVDSQGHEVPAGCIGEALFKGESVMDGYYGQDELTAEVMTPDGWLRTGDMMEMDAEGNFYLRSRKKDMVKSGGENVFVGEVEGVLRRHPDIDDCIVFSTSDAVMGEAVAAVVQSRPSADLTAIDVQRWCKKFIASYKKPRYVVFMDDLGRDDAGKVRKQEVVRFFEAHKSEAAPRLHEKICQDPDIYLIQVPFSWGTPIGHTNVYLIRSAERDLLVDTGVSHEAAFDILRLALDELGVDIERLDIFLTHFHIDHLGLAAAFAGRTTRVYLGAEDEALLRKRGFGSYRGTLKSRLLCEGFSESDLDELALEDGRLIPRSHWPVPDEFVNLGDCEEFLCGSVRMQSVATPGHTPGHRCLYLPDSGIMFLGDHILMDSSPNMAPFDEDFDSLEVYLSSLERVLRFPIRMALMGHGHVDSSIGSEELSARVRWLISHHEKRLEKIEAYISSHEGATGTDIAQSIPWNIPYVRWGDIPAIQKWIIACETVAHLDYLLNRSRVSKRLVQGVYRYFIDGSAHGA